jgi:hypothetical protein
MQQVSKHLLNLRRTWIGGNAEGMLKAVTTKNVDSYLRNRKEVLEQIKAFDEELKVTPLVRVAYDEKQCAWCDNTTLNKCWPKTHSDLR